jgi:hypothetical protein
VRLSREDGLLFYKLFPALMFYTNQKLKIVDEMASEFEAYLAVPGELRLQVRDALYAHRDVIDEFIRENPDSLTSDELNIVAGWKRAVVGTFYIFRYLKSYTVFLDDREPPKAYGVLAIADPLEDLLGPNLPILTKAVLLPFRGKIIYDGLLSPFRVLFGPGIRRSTIESYKKAKAAMGIITSLPIDEQR